MLTSVTHLFRNSEKMVFGRVLCLIPLPRAGTGDVHGAVGSGDDGQALSPGDGRDDHTDADVRSVRSVGCPDHDNLLLSGLILALCYFSFILNLLFGLKTLLPFLLFKGS